MNKKEQIETLLQEWQAENKEKRSVSLVMIEVTEETEKGYGTENNCVLFGKSAHFIDFFEKTLTDKTNPLSGLMNEAIKRISMRRIMGFFKKLSGSDSEKTKETDNDNK